MTPEERAQSIIDQFAWADEETVRKERLKQLIADSIYDAMIDAAEEAVTIERGEHNITAHRLVKRMRADRTVLP